MAPGITIALISQHLYPWETPLRKHLALVAMWTFAGVITFLVTEIEITLGVAICGLILSLITAKWLRNYFVATHALIPTLCLGLIFGTGWSFNFIHTLPISSLTRNLLLTNLFLALLSTPLGLMTLLPTQSYLLRKRWYRPRHSLNPEPRKQYPKVSFHVPCYAEPPNVVCATLDALSDIRYPNFEVIVIDNNTTNPALWHPLKYHCEHLNNSHSQEKFRFFHVEKLAGAKAGALNYILPHTAPDAEIIALIDADYQAQPDFLERLVGLFDDPEIGFVQTPHDYRDWENNIYQRACYWEYMLFFRLQLACLNEWVASYVIGTMCLVRRCAIEEAGGWAEWCLTEDSESAVRIHALGYKSIFVPETFGRGLIPETFRDYKKQRLRWTIGPIQQLFRHWRLYLPNPLATPSKLSFWQRLLEIAHSLGGTQPVISLAFLPLGLATLSSILYHQEVIIIPLQIWIGVLLVLPTGLGNTWLTYRLLGCKSIRDIVAAMLATLSLQHIRFVGAFKAVFGRSLRWKRTNKFKVLPNRLKAIKSAQIEFLLAATFILLSLILSPKASYAPPDLLCLVTLGLFSTGIMYLAAPMMALLAEDELQRHAPNFDIPHGEAERILNETSCRSRVMSEAE